MALGGGTFITQNKILPGAYVNTISATSGNTTLSDRGVATMPLQLNWGIEGDIFTITNEEFKEDSQKKLGYAYDAEELKGLRDLFKNAKTLYAYRLNGGGEKATCSIGEKVFATAKYSGTRGNDLKIVIEVNTDDETKWNVSTYLDTSKVDMQTVGASEELKANDYVVFESEVELIATAGVPLAGGTNKTVTGEDYQKYLDKIDSYTYNTMGVVVTDETTKKLFVSFNQRMRDEMGIKFQLVLYNMAADYFGVINVKNKCLDGATTSDGNIKYQNEAALVYWVTGLQAGCAVNKSCQNRVYDGEYTVDTDYTQTELKNAIVAGEFVLHRVNDDIRVLDDINSMVTVTDICGDIFKSNQTIRVIDHIANEDALLFNTKYLGVVPNDASGRISLWLDLVKIRQELQTIRAIENFSDSDVIVEQGETKKSVVANSTITVVNAMSQLYMTNVIA